MLVAHGSARRRSDVQTPVCSFDGFHEGTASDQLDYQTREERQAFAKYIALHKTYRHLLHSGRNFRLDSADKRQNIYGVHNDDEMLITVCQLTMPDYAQLCRSLWVPTDLPSPVFSSTDVLLGICMSRAATL